MRMQAPAAPFAADQPFLEIVEPRRRPRQNLRADRLCVVEFRRCGKIEAENLLVLIIKVGNPSPRGELL